MLKTHEARKLFILIHLCENEDRTLQISRYLFQVCAYLDSSFQLPGEALKRIQKSDTRFPLRERLADRLLLCRLRRKESHAMHVLQSKSLRSIGHLRQVLFGGYVE